GGPLSCDRGPVVARGSVVGSCSGCPRDEDDWVVGRRLLAWKGDNLSVGKVRFFFRPACLATRSTASGCPRQPIPVGVSFHDETSRVLGGRSCLAALAQFTSRRC